MQNNKSPSPLPVRHKVDSAPTADIQLNGGSDTAELDPTPVKRPVSAKRPISDGSTPGTSADRNTFIKKLSFSTEPPKLEYCTIILKPSVYSQAALTHIYTMLQTYDVKVSVKGVLPTSVVSRSKVIDSHFKDLQRWAEVVLPGDGGLTGTGRNDFRTAFDRDWDDCIAASLVFNAESAKKYLQLSTLDNVADYILNKMWQQTDAGQRVRLQKGVFCARFDRSSIKGVSLSKDVVQKLSLSPIYVINGFYAALKLQYQSNHSMPSYLVVEWDSNKTSWSDFMAKVIGDRDPALAVTGSIRASLLKNWERLSISAKPCVELNCMHVSGSAFESMLDRLNWHQGSIIFSDMLGSKLVAAGISAADIQRWLSNPMLGDRLFLDHMSGLDGDQCIVVAKALIGELPHA